MTQRFPHPFWHQGLVLWKTIFPRMVWGDGFGMIRAHHIYVHFISIAMTSAPPQALGPRGRRPLIHRPTELDEHRQEENLAGTKACYR